MQKIILELDKYKQYEPTQSDGETLWLLQYFLHDIRLSDITHYKEWAVRSSQVESECTNSTKTSKFEEYIIINSLSIMQKLILSLDQNNEYSLESCEGKTIWLLEILINDGLLRSIPYLIEYALSKDNSDQFGNVSLIKKNNKNIFIGFLYSDEPNNGPFFIISIPEFIKLLGEWKTVYELRPKEIIITEDHGIISVDAGQHTFNINI